MMRSSVSIINNSNSVASLLLLLLLSLVIKSSSSSQSLPTCQFMTEDTIPKYHVDNACDRVAHNSFGNRARRVHRIQELHRLKDGIQHVPNEKTITCPLPGTTSSSSSSLYPRNNQGVVGNEHIGMHTSWLVENTSKLPVVLAYVDPRTGQEFSAINSQITPPQADPQAILMPHQWKSIRTMEGHVFHVYELIGGGNGGDYQVGRLVLQHRVGLIPVQNKYASPDAIQCGDPLTLVDEPPRVEETHEIEPEFQRSPEIKLERCNVLYRGFRNTVGCPVHAYYIGQSPPPSLDGGVMGGMSCLEDFKFHLGINAQAPDFEFDWQAPTKFETTFVSHTFVFRLASNTSVLLDTHTFAPTQVVDCPDQETGVRVGQRQVSQAVAESVILPFGDKTAKNSVMMEPKVVVMTMMTTANKNNATRYQDNYYNAYNSSQYDYYNNNNNNNQSSSASEHSRHQRNKRSNRNAYMASATYGSSSRAY